MNTKFSFEFVSVKAFTSSAEGRISRYGNGLESVEMDEEKIILLCSRYEMDEMGGHVGYCDWKIIIPVWERKKFPRSGFPMELDDKLCLPSEFDVEIVSHPTIDEGYYPPDEDFLYQEGDYIIGEILDNLPVAWFDKDTRTWSIGDHQYALD